MGNSYSNSVLLEILNQSGNIRSLFFTIWRRPSESSCKVVDFSLLADADQLTPELTKYENLEESSSCATDSCDYRHRQRGAID